MSSTMPALLLILTLFVFHTGVLSLKDTTHFALQAKGPSSYTAVGYQDTVTIRNCTFRDYEQQGVGTEFHTEAALSFVDYRDSIHKAKVLDNKFINTNLLNPNNGHIPAILLRRSNAVVEGNEITGIYDFGVKVTNDSDLSLFSSHALLCSNYVSNSKRNGFDLRNYSGYCKLNTITGSGMSGYAGFDRDHGYINFSHHFGNSGPGIDLQQSTCLVDLSGTHSMSDGEGALDYGAFDTIESNSISQIRVDNRSKIILGNDLATWAWTEWCRNNVVKGSSASHLLISATPESNDIGDISSNYWDGHDPSLGGPQWSTTDPYTVEDGILYTYGINFLDWQNRVPGTISCESVPLGRQLDKKSGPHLLQDTSCKLKFAYGHGYNGSGEYATAYQILRSYAETCFDDSRSFDVFAELDAANENRSKDVSRYAEYREWLKSVLYLNQHDPMWYCECVKSMRSTYWWDERVNGVDRYAAIAIARYLLASGKCPQDSADMAGGERATRREVYLYWLDTCKLYGHDTSLFPLDTTIPTLHELGLDMLYGPEHSAVKSVAAYGARDLRITTNPFTSTTSATLQLAEPAYLRFEVFDVLGNVVQGDERGRSYPAGLVSFAINGQGLSPGVYFARVSTPEGETYTVRVVKR